MRRNDQRRHSLYEKVALLKLIEKQKRLKAFKDNFSLSNHMKRGKTPDFENYLEKQELDKNGSQAQDANKC